jgi:hypothetical protein
MVSTIKNDQGKQTGNGYIDSYNRSISLIDVLSYLVYQERCSIACKMK